MTLNIYILTYIIILFVNLYCYLMKSYGIVGGGIACLGALQGAIQHVQRNPHDKLDITIYETNNKAFTGFPYNDEYTPIDHLFNFPVDHMPIEKEHFIEWLKNNIPVIMQHEAWKNASPELQQMLYDRMVRVCQGDYKNTFLPRIIYGMYFHDLGSEYVKKLSQLGCNVQVKTNTNVISQQETNSEVNLTFQTKKNNGEDARKGDIQAKTVKHDKVLIAVGTTIQRGALPNYVFNDNLAEKIRNAILEKIEQDQKTLTINIEQANFISIEIHQTINEEVRKLVNSGKMPADFKINVETFSNSLRKIQFPYNEDFPSYKNQYFTVAAFDQHMKQNPNADPVETFFNLYQAEINNLEKIGIKKPKPWDVIRSHVRATSSEQILSVTEKMINDEYNRYKKVIAANAEAFIFDFYQKHSHLPNVKDNKRFFANITGPAPFTTIRQALTPHPNIERKFTTVSDTIPEYQKRYGKNQSYDLSFATWTRDPKYQQQLISNVKSTSRLRIIAPKLGTANNLKNAYDAGQAQMQSLLGNGLHLSNSSNFRNHI